MAFQFDIPRPEGGLLITIEIGSSAIFVGANGGGKTRLAVYIEKSLGLQAHRVSAHRALTLDPSVAKVSEQKALASLRTGYEQGQEGHRDGHRWGGKQAVGLLDDFSFVVQALFAEQSNRSLETHRKVRAGDTSPADATKFERLTEIWHRLLPHRRLHVTGDDIEVSLPNSQAKYKASEMSDGERAIFYMLGQTLLAADKSLLIVDEPELHVHRSIMSKLWDELEAARPDCGFVFITHDLEFAALRVAQKFVIHDYNPAPRWSIELVPESTGFSEETTTLILGSRRPILFVEGEAASLDAIIYRCCFPDWTVIPRGSCEEVIHSVVTMRRNQALTRVTCSGIVDADDYSKQEIEYLHTLGVATLPVSEIESALLLPAVSEAIAKSEGYKGEQLQECLAALKSDIFKTLDSDMAIEKVVMRYCRRRIDRMLKQIDFSAADNLVDLQRDYSTRTTSLDIAAIAELARGRIRDALKNQDLPALLAIYDNKALLAAAASRLKRTKLKDFEGWITRTLRNDTYPAIAAALRQALPNIRAQ